MDSRGSGSRDQGEALSNEVQASSSGGLNQHANSEETRDVGAASSEALREWTEAVEQIERVYDAGW